jgi:MOSC domain-containing protein YiiM
MVRRLNIDGDGQGDLVGHGGQHRAVFVYQIDSCHYWERQLGRDDFTCGQFGENFTIDGLSDQEASIGDRHRIGQALFEVTQPRVTCYRVGIRMNEPQMTAMRQCADLLLEAAQRRRHRSLNENNCSGMLPPEEE